RREPCEVARARPRRAPGPLVRGAGDSGRSLVEGSRVPRRTRRLGRGCAQRDAVGTRARARCAREEGSGHREPRRAGLAARPPAPALRDRAACECEGAVRYARCAVLVLAASCARATPIAIAPTPAPSVPPASPRPEPRYLVPRPPVSVEREGSIERVV